MLIRVTNLQTKAVYYHKYVTPNDVAWIKANSNLKVEVIRGR